MHRSNLVFTCFTRCFFILAGFSVLILSGCTTASPRSDRDQGFETAGPMPALNAPAENAAPVKVALLVPLSGRHASLGQGLLNAAQMALFDIGYNQFELVPRDTGGTAQGAASAAQQVIEGGAQIILGPVFAEEARAIKPNVRNAGISMIAFSTSHDLADNSTFVMGFLPFDQVERITQYAASRNLKRIGVITPSSEYGRTVINAYQLASKRAGLTSTQVISINPDTPSPESIRRFAITSANYDAVFMPFGGRSASTIADMLRSSGVPTSMPLLGTGLMDDTGLAAHPGLNTALFAAPAPAARASFEQRYQQTYGNASPRLATLAYDATALTVVLAQKASSAGVSPFNRTAITNPNGFAGLDGIFRFRQNGMAERGLAVLGFRNGRIETLDPAPATFQSAGQSTGM
jgi:branched-chain amino acid transport system substrate-binding protein